MVNKYPKSIEVNYYREFKPAIKRLESLTKKMVLPELNGLLASTPLKQNDISLDNSVLEEVKSLFKKIKQKFGFKKVRETLKKVILGSGRKIDGIHGTRFFKDMPLLKGKKTVNDYLSDWTFHNVELITDIPEDAIKQMQKLVMASVLRGDSKNYLASEIKKLLKTTDTRAKMIARDQSSKLYGALSRIKATSNGWMFYKWMDSNDERVRKDHARLDGKIFKFTEPPIVNTKTNMRGNVGDDFNCRCVPYIILDQDVINNLKKNPDGSYSAEI